MKGIILRTTRAREDDLIATIASEAGLLRAYRFYGMRHSGVLPGRWVDFELEHSGVFMPKMRRILLLQLGIERPHEAAANRYAAGICEGSGALVSPASPDASGFYARAEELAPAAPAASPSQPAAHITASPATPSTPSILLPKAPQMPALQAFWRFCSKLAERLGDVSHDGPEYYLQLLALAAELELAAPARAYANAAARVLSAEGRLGAQSSCAHCGAALGPACAVGGEYALFCSACAPAARAVGGLSTAAMAGFFASCNCAALCDEQAAALAEVVF